MTIFLYAWRLIRPRVYSMADYARLMESNPEELTFREGKALMAFAEAASK